MNNKKLTLNGYNKYHLWTSIYYEYLTNSKLDENYSPKEKRKLAIRDYLKLLKVGEYK